MKFSFESKTVTSRIFNNRLAVTDIMCLKKTEENITYSKILGRISISIPKKSGKLFPLISLFELYPGWWELRTFPMIWTIIEVSLFLTDAKKVVLSSAPVMLKPSDLALRLHAGSFKTPNFIDAQEDSHWRRQIKELFPMEVIIKHLNWKQ